MVKIYCATNPEARVSGAFLQYFINGSGLFSNTLKETLASHGLKNVRLGEWYSQQQFLNAIKTIEKLIGPVLIYQVGWSIGNTMALPAEMETTTGMLESCGVIYRYYHRDCFGDTIIYERGDENRGAVILETPYPLDLERGFITGLVQRMQASMPFRVDYEKDASVVKGGHKVTRLTVVWSAQSGAATPPLPKK